MSVSFEEVMQSFLDEYRWNKNVSIQTYEEAYPQYAREIRDLFPTLMFVENELDEASVGVGDAEVKKNTPRCPEKIAHYRILREVGSGGMGIVYEARDEILDRSVALKVLWDYPGRSSRLIERFKREIKTAARLHHMNIVSVYDSGAFENHFYYVMQFIDGISVEQLLSKYMVMSAFRDVADAVPPNREIPKDSGPKAVKGSAGKGSVKGLAEENPDDSATEPLGLPPAVTEREWGENGLDVYLTPLNNGISSDGTFDYWLRSVCRIGLQVSSALEYAHKFGVLHRDIKPSNLMIDKNGTVWVMDLGLAKPSADNGLTLTGQVIGTLRYMAPECLDNVYTVRSDLFSLGLTLYEMIAFEPAYLESNNARLLSEISKASIVSLRRINRAIPRDLETIVIKTTEKTPEKRYACAAQLSEDLQRFLDDRPVQARRTSQLYHAWRWAGRNRITAGLLSAAVLLLVSFTVTVSFLNMAKNGYLNEVRQLLAEQEFEAKSAEANLNLAIDALDGFVSSPVGGQSAVQLADFTLTSAPVPENSCLTPGNLQVLESFVHFYDRYIFEKQNSEQRLMYTAAAYGKVAYINQINGDRDKALKLIIKSRWLFNRGIARCALPNIETLRTAGLITDFCQVLDVDQLGNPFYTAMIDEYLRRLASLPEMPENRRNKKSLLARLHAIRGQAMLASLLRDAVLPGGLIDRDTSAPPVFRQTSESTSALAAVEEELSRAEENVEALIRDYGRNAEFCVITASLEISRSFCAAVSGDPAESAVRRQKALALTDQIKSLSNDSILYEAHRYRILLRAAFSVQLSPGEASESAAIVRQLIESAENLHRRCGESATYATDLLTARALRAGFAFREGRLDDAVRDYEETVETYKHYEERYSGAVISRCFAPIYYGSLRALAAVRRYDDVLYFIGRMEYELNLSEVPDHPTVIFWDRRLQKVKARVMKEWDEFPQKGGEHPSFSGDPSQSERSSEP